MTFGAELGVFAAGGNTKHPLTFISNIFPRFGSRVAGALH